jgi:endonuclease-8
VSAVRVSVGVCSLQDGDVPEGDTIHKVAARLQPALAGHRLVRFEAPGLRGDRPAPGERIEAVEAHGKHLLIHFGGGLSLRTHLRMAGSWHLYRAGERWRRPRHQLRALVEADSGWQAACFAAPEVETYRRPPGDASGRGATGTPALARLGPDLCADGVDLDVVVGRLGSLGDGVAVGDALLDQRVAAGIGNVYKSEACFACALDPFTPLGDVDAASRRRLYEVAHRMLRANLGPGPRRTHPGGLAVYGKPGQPCPRCGGTIRVRRQGPYARSTYWCSACQRRPVRQP